MRFIGVAIALATVSATALACSSTKPGQEQNSSGSSGSGSGSSGSGDSGSSDTGLLDGLVDCTTDPLAETYVSNMQQAGTGGTFKFVLVKSMSLSAQGQMVEAPPVLNGNTWIIKLLDKNGAAVTDAIFPPESSWPAGWPVGVYPFMPHHGHGSSAWPTVTNNMDGTYTIDNIYLYMAGLWTITLNAKSGTWTDSAVFGFCIQG
jgi:hypothetical protein